MRRWLVLWWGDGEDRTDKLGVELGQPGLALAVKDQECVDHGGGGEGCAGMFRGLWRTARLLLRCALQPCVASGWEAVVGQ